MSSIPKLHSILIAAALLAAVPGYAQDDDGEDDEFRAGLVATYVGPEGRTAASVVPRVAFSWGEQSPDRRVGPGDFEAVWRGNLLVRVPGDYRIAAFVRGGAVEVKVADRTVLTGGSHSGEWLESERLNLEFDFHPLRVRFNKQNSPASIVLYWSGPNFQLEPLGARSLFHAPSESVDGEFQRGLQLARALRCAACHEIPSEPQSLAAPSLLHLNGTLRRSWLVERLQTPASGRRATDQRMPHFGLSPDEAEDVASYLFSASTPAAWSPEKVEARSPATKRRRNKAELKKDPVAAGERLFLTIGCRACHTEGGSPSKGSLFGGGSLAEIGGKRPRRFFEQWLAAPETINSAHRMPVFQMTTEERRHLTAYLATRGSADASPETSRPGSAALERGRGLVARFRCGACHELPGPQQPSVPRLPLPQQWASSCFGQPGQAASRPGYGLPEVDRRALIRFLEDLDGSQSASGHLQRDAENLLVERNCLACHARDGTPGLASSLTDWATERQELAPLIPAMTPPELDHVGDKLHSEALGSAIKRETSPYRDYLLVRMPRFPLDDVERKLLVDHFVDVDRVPDVPARPEPIQSQLDSLTLLAAGSRLVTADGFGCTSCHQVGSVRPSKAPLNTRGPSLSECGARIRREWFDRFVRNPARINRALEMPSVQLAVRGVLDGQLDRQLAAVWEIVNTPGFEPPEPGPLRTVRHSGVPSPDQQATVITDVVRTRDDVYLKPLLIGLGNRHNVLFDLESASLARWSIGDTARQRTEGKTWFWEAAGTDVFRQQMTKPELSLIHGGRTHRPEQVRQFPTEITSLAHHDQGIDFRHQFHFSASLAGTPMVLSVEQQYRPQVGAEGGFRRRVFVRGVPESARVRLQLVDMAANPSARITGGGRTLEIPEGQVRISLLQPADAKWSTDGSVTLVAAAGSANFELDYRSGLAVDRFLTPENQPLPPPSAMLRVVPGFAATRLPISDDMMPTAMAWRPNGELVIASLGGRVWTVRDLDRDGLEEDLRPFSDDFAAPYGIAATDEYVDVVTKFALVRLFDDDNDRRADRMETIASGWGHTTDYHDWAVGLPQGADGSYYIALPCQQDQRSEAAAHLRGFVLRLVPREPTSEDPSLFRIQKLTGGHRFPMGLALRNDGELFVTDNQGNYNPFNELNHVVAPRRFGFINLLERKPGFNPPLTPPAINIPHPWTRSVNGICFLQPSPGGTAGEDAFAPFAGHLIGCEYDTRRLVRMTVHRVAGEYQGAIYPFSYDAPSDGPPFLGPLSCAVSPSGDLYVGGIHDSGWGGGNNIGEVVRLRPKWDELPCGISEVQAHPAGLKISFTRPVDRRLAADPKNYAISTYTRTSTPAYGGDDEQRRSQPVKTVTVAEDRKHVMLELDPYLVGHVYEVHLKNLTPDGAEFFPAEAHYTMRAAPVERIK